VQTRRANDACLRGRVAPRGAEIFDAIAACRGCRALWWSANNKQRTCSATRRREPQPSPVTVPVKVQVREQARVTITWRPKVVVHGGWCRRGRYPRPLGPLGARCGRARSRGAAGGTWEATLRRLLPRRAAESGPGVAFRPNFARGHTVVHVTPRPPRNGEHKPTANQPTWPPLPSLSPSPTCSTRVATARAAVRRVLCCSRAGRRAAARAAACACVRRGAPPRSCRA
jgi:hypothetical protein